MPPSIPVTVTAPLETVKFAEAKDATPLFDAVASSASTVNVFEESLYVKSIPSTAWKSALILSSTL